MEKNNSLTSGKGENGKWITVNGSHIFVEDGQSIEDAMNKQFSKSGSQMGDRKPNPNNDKPTDEKNVGKTFTTKDGKYEFEITGVSKNNEGRPLYNIKDTKTGTTGHLTSDELSNYSESSSKGYYDKSKKDKYGNPMLNQKYHDIAKKAGQDYINDMTKHNSIDKLLQSNVFPGYLCNKICDGLNNATDDIPDITTTELENIVSELTGYKFDYDAYESKKGGWTTYFSKK